MPLWFLLLSPKTWLFLIATQFIIVSLVLYAALKFIEHDDPTQIWRKSIIWNTLYGFISYLIMCFFFLLTHLVDADTGFGDWVITNLAQALNVNPFSSIYSILYVLLCLLITQTLTYVANKNLAFRGAKLTAEEKHKVALFLSIFSGPFIALFPSYLLY